MVAAAAAVEGGGSLKISVISSNGVLLLGNYTATLLWSWTAMDGTFLKKKKKKNQ